MWNGAIDRRPALIARCARRADVVARGAHSRATHGPADRRARRRPLRRGTGGVRRRADDRPVADAAHRGRSRQRAPRAPSPACCGASSTPRRRRTASRRRRRVSHTGIAGLTLGGGIGWLTRKLRGDGRQPALGRARHRGRRRSDARARTSTARPVWGLRGGGGNFGIVTSFEYRLHEVGRPCSPARSSRARGRARGAAPLPRLRRRSARRADHDRQPRAQAPPLRSSWRCTAPGP